MENTNDFLPTGYEMPESTKWNYFKVSNEKQKIRILSSAIIGWVDWNDKKPVRTKTKPNTNFDDSRPAKHFRAFVIWNYNKEELQVWEVTQNTIREQLTTFINWEWGNPKGYDIVVWKEGEKMETKYFLSTTPHWIKEVDLDIELKYKEANVDLNELYSGGNPFAPESKF